MKNKVFLGGTCAESTWRNQLINFLDIDYFNPVVDDWNESCQEEERQQKLHHCNIHLYVITSQMIGAFSIAEAIESVMSGKVTIFHVIPEGFNKQQIKSFEAIVDMVEKNGGYAEISDNLADVSFLLNHKIKYIPEENNFRGRLILEYNSLLEKYEKLYSFIDSNNYNKLSSVDRALLRLQLSTMKSYSIILEERIKRLAQDDLELNYY